MNTSKSVRISAIMGKIASITGYVAGGFSLLVIIAGLTDFQSYGAAEAVVIFLIILAPCIFLVYKGTQIKKRIKRLNKYVSLITIGQITSLENIAESTSQPVEFVSNDLQKMIDKKLIANAYIDVNRNEIITSWQSSPASGQELKPLGGYMEPHMEPNDVSPKKERQPNPYAITSLVLAIVPIIIILLVIVFFQGFFSDSNFGFVAGATWPLFMFLPVAVLMMGISADILAVIFGVIAIVKRKTPFSWLGIIIVALKALILFVM